MMIRSGLGLDEMNEKLGYLVENSLTKRDMHGLGVVSDARKGIFLPGHTIASIIKCSAIASIKDIIGKSAPTIPPMSFVCDVLIVNTILFCKNDFCCCNL